MSLQTYILKLIEGITDISLRATIVTTLAAIREAYRRGIISEDELRRDLAGICLDILSVKYPLKDVEELRSEAEQWADELFRLIKIEAVRLRYLARYSRRETE